MYLVLLYTVVLQSMSNTRIRSASLQRSQLDIYCATCSARHITTTQHNEAALNMNIPT